MPRRRAYVIVIVLVALLGGWSPEQTLSLLATGLLFLIISESTWTTPAEAGGAGSRRSRPPDGYPRCHLST